MSLDFEDSCKRIRCHLGDMFAASSPEQMYAASLRMQAELHTTTKLVDWRKLCREEEWPEEDVECCRLIMSMLDACLDDVPNAKFACVFAFREVVTDFTDKGTVTSEAVLRRYYNRLCENGFLPPQAVEDYLKNYKDDQQD